jgi:hypothetical protein
MTEPTGWTTESTGSLVESIGWIAKPAGSTAESIDWRVQSTGWVAEPVGSMTVLVTKLGTGSVPAAVLA